MIEVEGLTKLYEGRAILDGITTRFARGEVVSVIGPSGVGKTTLLRCLNGLEPFDRGVVRVDGRALRAGVTHGRELRLVRERVGFVFQTWNLFAHRTVLGNVIEGPVHVKKVPAEEARRRAREILGRVGVAHREGAYPSELSGGEQQRVAIARALAMEPEALLLDEPTSALDPERVGDLIDLLRSLSAGRLTLLIATHEMRLARAISSRVMVLWDGKIIEEGPPDRVLVCPEHARTRALLDLGDPSG
jgi:polar amino acid transport system ATP-binding protein